jgi:hypothetical protein
MTIRMQKRYSFVAGLIEAQIAPCMPEYAVLPRGRFSAAFRSWVLNGKSAAPTDHWGARAAL